MTVQQNHHLELEVPSMDHEIHRVVSFQKVAPFTLHVQFDDGTSQVINFRPVLEGQLYGPLKEPKLFD